MTTRTIENTTLEGWNGSYPLPAIEEQADDGGKGIETTVEKLAQEGLDKLFNYLREGIVETDEPTSEGLRGIDEANDAPTTVQEDPNFFVPPGGGSANLA